MNEMKQKTHLSISKKLVGSVVSIQKNRAKVTLTTTEKMKADNQGLVHGGFVFGLADYAAMLVVNKPNVVLGKAEVKFTKPVTTDEELIAEAILIKKEGDKYEVNVKIENAKNTLVFEGVFICFNLKNHVLK